VPEHHDLWASLARPTPAWFRQARFGIFVHWGAYSVPAWAEPLGALGTIPDDVWFPHNPYAEWYANTIRIPGSPAAQHHADIHGDAPYDDFLDAWQPDEFDADAWARLFADVGADYVIPTTKHHDGIALWDAPGTGTRNTVHRGPRRDLIGEIAAAVRRQGLRFGVYYSGGLDWGVTDLPPQLDETDLMRLRPVDAAYNFYAIAHVRDLMRRYQPDVLWNDIEWPDAGKRGGPDGLVELFRDFYAGNPDGVVNDRWGVPHSDFRTSEYAHAAESEQAETWENTRGIGYSFGHNAVEEAVHTLTPGALARHWADVVSRGGRLLLNVGPTASGRIPDLQRATLSAFGSWKHPLAALAATARPTPEPDQADGWRREWLTRDGVVVIAGEGRHQLAAAAGEARILTGSGRLADGVLEVDDELPTAALIPGAPAAPRD